MISKNRILKFIKHNIIFFIWWVVFFMTFGLMIITQYIILDKLDDIDREITQIWYDIETLEDNLNNVESIVEDNESMIYGNTSVLDDIYYELQNQY